MMLGSSEGQSSEAILNLTSGNGSTSSTILIARYSLCPRKEDEERLTITLSPGPITASLNWEGSRYLSDSSDAELHAIEPGGDPVGHKLVELGAVQVRVLRVEVGGGSHAGVGDCVVTWTVF